MARLLVSVRSADEALRAFEAGAQIIDVKEPDRGSLGRADWPVWREVRSALPQSVPMSVALGEMTDWLSPAPPILPEEAWSGIAFRKLGLAGAGTLFHEPWIDLRARFRGGHAPGWIAVAYADWREANAPSPYSVVEAANGSTEIVGILIDTWSKTRQFKIVPIWIKLAREVHDAGMFLAVAGGLDRRSITTLDQLSPEIVAVRGAACIDGQRQRAIDPVRVAELARIVAALPSGSTSLPLRSNRPRQGPASNFTPCASGSSEP